MTEDAIKALVQHAYALAYRYGYADGKMGIPPNTEKISEQQIALIRIYSEANRLNLD